MSEFKNVTVVKKANIYFDGKVASHTILLADGSKKTLGVMQPGEYEFNTQAAEVMELLSGELTVLLPGCNIWQSIGAGQSFDVPANSKFVMRVTKVSDYCCSFVD